MKRPQSIPVAGADGLDRHVRRTMLFRFGLGAALLLAIALAVAFGRDPDKRARQEGRPRRRYYELTPAGKRRLGEAAARFKAVSQLFPKRSTS